MPERNSTSDIVREMQALARRWADAVAPGLPARRVLVLGDDGVRLLDTPVPACACAPTAAAALEEVEHGWRLTDRAAFFDGQRVPVAGSRLALLRALVESDEPATAKELAAAAFDRETSIDNVRYHLRKLREELKAAFTYDGDVIQGDDEGYRLVLR